MLGVCCHVSISLVSVSRGYSLVAVLGLFLSQSMTSKTCRFWSCGSWSLGHKLNSCGMGASLLWGVWGFPRLGIRPVSPASAGGFFTTEPPWKPQNLFSWVLFYCTLQIFHFFFFFFQIESLSNPAFRQVFGHHLSNNHCSRCVSVHILAILIVFQAFSLLLSLLWWPVISDMWCYSCQKLQLAEGSDDS